jgi:hypothetical protein
MRAGFGFGQEPVSGVKRRPSDATRRGKDIVAAVCKINHQSRDYDAEADGNIGDKRVALT